MTAASEIDIHPITDACFIEEAQSIIGASEVGSLFGVGFKTLAQLKAEKDGLTGLGPDPESALIRRGHALEPVAIEEMKKLKPDWSFSRGTNHYVDRVHRLAAKPDGTIIDPTREGVGSLEIKVVSRMAYRRDWPDDTPPLGYLLQLATQMMLLPDCTWGAIGALVVGEFTFDAHIYPVERNRSAETRIRTAVADFWRKVDAGEQPTIDFERDGALIALMFPNEVPGKVVDLSTDNAIQDLLERRAILRDTAKDVEKRLTACENEIKMKVGDAEAAILPGWRLTLKTQHRSAYEVKATSYRVLRANRFQPERALTSGD